MQAKALAGGAPDKLPVKSALKKPNAMQEQLTMIKEESNMTS